MIIGCIVTYNDFPLIKDCIESIIDKVDKIIVLDGRYKDFPTESRISNDGTLEYLCNLDIDNPNKITIGLVYDLDEVKKRNFYLNYLKDGDICLNIDADEVLIGEIPELKADIGIIQIGEQGDCRRHRRTIRFFRYKKGLHYWGKHSLILDNKDKVFAHLDKIGEDYNTQKITEFEFLHNNHRRGYNRIKDKKKYYQILMKREAKINEPVN